VGNLPSGSLKNDALGMIGGYWSKTDAAAAAQWAMSLPPGAGQRNAVRGVTNELLRVDMIQTTQTLEFA
jgi:hypothetical protein